MILVLLDRKETKDQQGQRAQGGQEQRAIEVLQERQAQQGQQDHRGQQDQQDQQGQQDQQDQQGQQDQRVEATRVLPLAGLPLVYPM